MERPSGNGPLVLEVAVIGADARQGDDCIEFRAATGRVWRYGSLEARDALGRPLGARLEVAEGGRVRAVLEDAGAVYPVLVNPLLTGVADAQLESD